MRRRIRSATVPLHRHTLAQLAVDGALVALAYWLAFQLRFTNGPTGYYAHLRERTIWWVLAGSFVVLLSSRVYQRRWRSSWACARSRAAPTSGARWRLSAAGARATAPC